MACGHVPRAATMSSRVHTLPNHRITSVKYPSSNRVAINVNGTKYDISKSTNCLSRIMLNFFTVRKVAGSLGMLVIEDDDVEW